jgi:hypothetical protein
MGFSRKMGSDCFSPARADKSPRQRIGYVVTTVFMETAHNEPILAPTPGFEHKDEHSSMGFYVRE